MVRFDARQVDNGWIVSATDKAGALHEMVTMGADADVALKAIRDFLVSIGTVPTLSAVLPTTLGT
jgi:hypothetical protein